MLRKRILPTTCLVIAILVISCNGHEVSSNTPSSPSPVGSSAVNKNAPEPSATATAAENGQPLRITLPADKEQVGELPFVEGVVSDSTANVWVIVHPMEIATRWVQPLVTMREGGKWRVQIHVGRPGTVDVEKHFEIMAVATPKKTLKEGDELRDWPEAKWKSPVIEVIRK